MADLETKNDPIINKPESEMICWKSWEIGLLESAQLGVAAVILLSHQLSGQSVFEGLSGIHGAQLLLLVCYTEPSTCH